MRRLLNIDSDLLQFSIRVGLASLGMAAVSWISLYPLQAAFDSGKTPLRLGIVCAVLVMSGAAFLGVSRLLKLSEVEQTLNAALDLLPWSRFAPTQ